MRIFKVNVLTNSYTSGVPKDRVSAIGGRVMWFLNPLTNNSYILVENRIFNVKCQNPIPKFRDNLSSKGGLGKKSKYQNNYKYTSFDI